MPHSLIGEFFVRMLNGFAAPASWMATTKGLSTSVKKGFLYPYNNWSHRVAIWNFVKDIPLENHHPTKNFFRRLKMHYQTFLRLRYWHVGACRIFASIQVFWRSGRKGCLIFKPLLVRTQDTTYWRILLIFFKKESNPSLANWLLMCTCNFLNSMLGY